LDGYVPACFPPRRFLFSLGKPRPLGGVRVNWLCLEITPNGVLEYWSIGVLILKTKKRWFELSKLLKVLFLLKKRIIEFFHYSITPSLQYSNTPKNFRKAKTGPLGLDSLLESPFIQNVSARLHVD
jgi:hypothetical protein